MKIQGITKVFHNKYEDVVALDNLTLEFLNKGMYVIIGPSGCGKTTLLNVLAGNYHEFDGTIHIDGNVVLMQQEIVLIEAMTVYDNLSIISKNKEKIMEYIQWFKLEDCRDKKVKKLSNGQKKRVQLISCLLLEPEYLLCDEPTASLDYENKQIVMQLLKEISDKICVIMITHDIAISEMYGDVLIKMDQGKILHIENINRKEPIAINQSSINKKGITFYFLYLWRSIAARKKESFLMIFLAFMMMVTFFIGSNLFSQATLSAHTKEKWYANENKIVTKSVDHSANIPYMKYDIYDNNDLHMVLENVDGIIGYTKGNDNNEAYSSRHFNPRITYEELQKILDEIQLKIDNQEELTLAEQQFYIRNQKNPYIKPSEEYINETITVDDRRSAYKYKNAVIDESSPYYNIVNYYDKISPGLTLGIYNYTVYTLKEDTDMFLAYGDYPIKENEIIISDSTAKSLLMYYSFHTIEELIGQTITFNIETIYEDGTLDSLNKKTENKEISFIVCGITNYDTENEYRLYSFSNYYEDYLYEQLHWDKNLMQYQYIYFLCDPAYDENEIALEINQMLGSNYSLFDTEHNTLDNEKYRNPQVFYMYFIVACLAISIIVWVVLFYFKNRNKKELKLIHTYKYNPYVVMLLKNIFYFISAFILLSLYLPVLCNQFNAYALSLKYQTLLEHDYGLLGIICIICLFVVWCEEVILYVYGNKKH